MTGHDSADGADARSERLLGDVSLRWKLAGNVLLVFLLALANVAGIWLFVQDQERDATVVNVAGQQRMLVQAMMKEAYMVDAGYDERRASLAATAAAYNRSLADLQEGEPDRQIPPPPPSVEPQLEVVEAEWQQFSARVRVVAEAPRDSRAYGEALAYLRRNEGQLLAQTDKAVRLYERAHRRKVAGLERFLEVVLVLDLLALGLLVYFSERDLIAPIEGLAEDADAIAAGDRDRDIETVDAADEVGRLTRSVGEMKSQLIASLRDVEVFRAAVDQAGSAIFIADTDGTIEYVNAAFEEMTGYPAAEAVGETPHILHSGDQDPEYYRQLWDTILGGEVWEREIVNQRRSGERFTATQTIAPITDESGAISRFVAIQTDITDRRLRKRRLAVLDRILRHNLRNDVNVIHGYADLLLETVEDGEAVEAAATIQDTAGRLEALSQKAHRVERILDRSDSVHRRVPVGDLLADVESAVTDEHPEATVTFDVRPGADVAVDSTMRHALEEVVENALKHNDRPEPTVEVTVSTDGETATCLEVAVADDGPGIPDHERAILHEREETPLVHGSGLGLYLVHWLVSSAGGKVTVADREPRGSLVTLTLPLGGTRAAAEAGAVD